MSLSSAAKSSPMASQKVALGLRMRVRALPQERAPVEGLVGGFLVFVDVVFVADVEGGIGEGQVDGVFGEGVHAGDAFQKLWRRLRSRGMALWLGEGG